MIVWQWTELWTWFLIGLEILTHTVCFKHESTYSISSALHAWSGSWTSSRALSTCVREETRSRLCPGLRKRLTDCRYSSEALNTRKSYLMKKERGGGEAERDGNKNSRINYSSEHCWEEQNPISHYISINPASDLRSGSVWAFQRATGGLKVHEIEAITAGWARKTADDSIPELLIYPPENSVLAASTWAMITHPSHNNYK